MTERLEQLQLLSTLLSEYAEVLTERSSELPESPESPESVASAASAASRQALLHIYGLQLNVVSAIDALIRAGTPPPKRRLGSTESANLLLRDLKAAVETSRLKPCANISELLVNRALAKKFERLYTILGPNNFPDDEDDTPEPPPIRK